MESLNESVKPVSKLLRILFVLIQLSWGLPQSLFGFVLFIVYGKCPHGRYRAAIRTGWEIGESGVSLGLFIFTCRDDERLVSHEYGHSLQSLILGPLYLPVIGIPSICWCRIPALEKLRREKGIDYYSFYTEKWAEHLASRFRE